MILILPYYSSTTSFSRVWVILLLYVFILLYELVEYCHTWSVGTWSTRVCRRAPAVPGHLGGHSCERASESFLNAPPQPPLLAYILYSTRVFGPTRVVWIDPGTDPQPPSPGRDLTQKGRPKGESTPTSPRASCSSEASERTPRLRAQFSFSAVPGGEG